MKSKSNPDFLKKDRSCVTRQLRNIRSKVSEVQLIDEVGLDDAGKIKPSTGTTVQALAQPCSHNVQMILVASRTMFHVSRTISGPGLQEARHEEIRVSYES